MADSDNDSVHSTGGPSFQAPSQQSTTESFLSINGKTYLSIDHAANLRKGTSVSWIWEYGRELRLLDREDWQRCWQCGLCGQGNETIYVIDDSTYNAGQHLRKKHKVIQTWRRNQRSTPSN
jgi:hypothetical protein